jgi:sporadic carbohydrate cluster protein (TIGR04323 family)
MMTRKLKKLGFRGYIFSRKIDGNFIPQRVQNLVIKDYCQRKKLFFKLSATEYKMEHCYLMLNSVLKDIKKINGIIFYSLFMLPEEKKDRDNLIIKILKKNKEIHFAVEEIEIKSIKNIKDLNNILMIRKVSN